MVVHASGLTSRSSHAPSFLASGLALGSSREQTVDIGRRPTPSGKRARAESSFGAAPEAEPPGMAGEQIGGDVRVSQEWG
jgi:hypothetical protein